jgi:hypothetical protein
MKIKAALLFGGLLAAASHAVAQGDFPFGDIPGLDVEPTVEIDLNPTMMGFLSEAAKGAQSEAAAALSGVTNVRVRVYEGISDDMEDVLKFVDDTSTQLQAAGWNTVVRVREQGEHVRIFMQPGANGTISGLTVMVADGGPSNEAVFINVAGAIEPAQLGKIAAAIGMDGMFSMVPGIEGGAAQKGPQD